MSEKLNLDLNVDIAVHDEDQLVAVRKEMHRLAQEITAVASALKGVTGGGASFAKAASGAKKAASEAMAGEENTLAALKRRWSFQSRMSRQRDGERAKEARAARQEAAEAERRFRDSLNFNTRLAAQREKTAKAESSAVAKAAKEEARAKASSIREATRVAERAAKDRARAEADAERQVRNEIRETARLRAREQREAERRQREHERNMDRAARGAGRVRDGAGRVGAYAAASGALMGYGATRAVRRGVSTRAEIDAAETSLRVFNDLPDGKGGRRAMTGADIRKLRRGSGGLDAEAIRNGVSVTAAIEAYNEASKAGLQDPMEQTRTILSAGSALELDPRGITKLFGTMSRNLGKDATPARLKSVANAIAIAAREDPTQSNEIVEGMNRAQSVLALSSGISEEDLAGLVSGGISAGIQPGKAGTHISSLAKSISEGGNKFLDPKKRKELNFAARKLGFGSARDMAGQFAGKGGKKVLYQIFEGLKAMAPAMRSQVADALSGGQWSDEDLQVVNGLDGMKSTDAAIHDKKNANFLTDARNQRMTSWQSMWNQSQTVFSLFWESFGSGFDGILREINAFFLDLHSRFNYDQVSQYVRDAIDGLRTGLGFSSWREALQSIFPSDISGMGPSIRAFFTGFGEGLRSIGSVIRSVAGFFAGGDGASNMGSLAGKLVALGVAAVALAPVLGVIGALASIIAGIAGVARAASGVLGAGAAGAAMWTTAGKMIGLGFLAEVAQYFNVLKPDSKKGFLGNIVEEFIPAPLRRWMDSDGGASKTEGSTTAEVIENTQRQIKELESIVESVKPQGKVLDKIEENTREGARIQKQSFDLQEESDSPFKALIQKAAFTGVVGSAVAQVRALGVSSSGSSGGAAGGFDTSGPSINHSVPGGSLGNGLTGMRRRGIIGGGGRSGGGVPAIPDSVPMTAAERNQLGLILQHESGGRNVMNGVGASRGVSPTAAKGYTAQGYYQMLNSNWRRIAPGLGITAPNAMAASFEDQTKVALHLLRNGGIGNWSNFNPKLRAALARGDQAQFAVPGAGGGADGAPQVGGGSGRSQARMEGQVDIEGTKYDFGSGGHRGANSIPAGTYPITPDAIGPWGRSHGAIGINGNRIWDSTLNRFRDGIEFHAASNGRKITAGCIGIAREQYGQFKAHVMDVIRRQGRAYLTVDENGRAAITGGSPAASAAKASEQGLQDIGEGMKSSGWKKSPSAPGGNAPLGTNTPIKPSAVPNASGGGGGSTVHAPINIHGAHHTPEELANTVQRKIQESMNRRTHDYDTFA